jgi:two-component system response regulator VicR
MTARVLVVDDSNTTQEMVGLHLIKAGYEVKSALDGDEAVEMAMQWRPSLILMDVMMPTMNGYTAVRKIREFSSTPIIMLSAKGSEEDKVQGLNAGADDYVVKPYSSEELMARLRAMLRRSKPNFEKKSHHRIFQHGDLLIDVDRNRVTVGGDVVTLTATEFGVLLSLAESMGEPVDGKRLLSMVWGERYITNESILAGTIRRLREKVEREPQDPVHIIANEKGGYLMPDTAQEFSPPVVYGGKGPGVR